MIVFNGDLWCHHLAFYGKEDRIGYLLLSVEFMEKGLEYSYMDDED
jgi:hypothetical protein